MIPLHLLLACTDREPSDPPRVGCTEETIGDSGGSLGVGGVWVDVPPDALPRDRTLTLCIDGSAPVDATSVIVELSPAELTLALPATLTLPYSGDAAALVDENYQRQILATDSGGELVAPIWHFGTWYAIEDRSIVVPYEGNGTPLADILFVVDNSCGMTDNQVLLAESFGRVLPELAAVPLLDWHVGVVTTDIDNEGRGELQHEDGVAWLDPTTLDPVATFRRMVLRGESGSGNEKGLGASYFALEIMTENAGFRRVTGALAVVVVSDEPDSTQSSIITVPEYHDWFEGLVAPERSWFHGVLASESGRYVTVVNGTGGSLFDVEAADWTGFLEGVVAPLAEGDSGMPLSPLPIPNTIRIWEISADGADVHLLDPDTFTWDPDTNRVLAVPEVLGDMLWVEYQPAPT